MGIVYGVVLVLGAVVIAGFAVFRRAGAGGSLKVLGIAALCAVYSAVQLFRATPRRFTSTLMSDDGRLE